MPRYFASSKEYILCVNLLYCIICITNVCFRWVCVVRRVFIAFVFVIERIYFRNSFCVSIIIFSFSSLHVLFIYLQSFMLIYTWMHIMPLAFSACYYFLLLLTVTILKIHFHLYFTPTNIITKLNMSHTNWHTKHTLYTTWTK